MGVELNRYKKENKVLNNLIKLINCGCFSVKVGNSGGGIYIRRQSHLSQDSVYTVIVSVSFSKKKLELYPDMFKFHMAVTLSASEEWVRCADCLSLSTGDKAFKLEVRASRLKPGCHFAAVYGYDATKPDKGIPIYNHKTWRN